MDTRDFKSSARTLIDDLVDSLFEYLNEIAGVDVPPGLQDNIRKVIKRFFDPILKKIEESRIPRIAIIGRTRAGKTSLLRSIFEQELGVVKAVYSATPKHLWTTLNGPNGEVAELLDTRGLQDGIPPEGASAIPSLEAVLTALDEKLPDIFMFLVKSTEVNAAIDSDIKSFDKCLQKAKSVYRSEQLTVMGIPTQCDQLAPFGFWDDESRLFYSAYWNDPEIDILRDREHPDFEYRLEKLQNIQAAVSVWGKQLTRLSTVERSDLRIIPTSAQVRFRPDGTIDPRVDTRWNIIPLKKFILEELPQNAKLQFYRLARVKEQQRQFSRDVIKASSSVCSIVGAWPTPPGFDLPFLLALQILQIALIGYISGRKEMNWKIAAEFLAAAGLQTGAGFILRELFRYALTFGGPPGWLISGAIAGVGTATTGKIAEAYFIDGLSIEEAKKITGNISGQ